MILNNLRNFCDTFKSSHSCVDFLNSLGINVSRSGQCINAPHFIRQNDRNPSFAVYDSGCIDFATGNFYDIFNLDMLAFNRDFKSSFEALTGESLSPQHEYSREISSSHSRLLSLEQNISLWHKNLLSSPDILQYLHNRAVSDDTIRDMHIGYDPKEQRIIFPYKKNGRFIYYAGRDVSGTPGVHKYKKLPVHFDTDNIPLGLDTLRLAPKSPKTYTGQDGEQHEDPDQYDPKDDTLIIVEGIVDFISFRQEGWQTLSGGGGDFRSALLPQIYDICRQFKKVFICFDNDSAGQKFQRKWMQRFFEQRINFICGHTPAGNGFDADGRPLKFDVNDYYVAEKKKGNNDCLTQLVQNASPGLVELSKEFSTLDEISDFLERSARYATTGQMQELKDALSIRVSDKIIGQDNQGRPVYQPLFTPKQLNSLFASAKMPPSDYSLAQEVSEKRRLLFNVNDGFYEYKGGIWKRSNDYFIQRYIFERLGRKASMSKVSKVREALKTFLAQEINFNAQHVFTFANGTLLLDERDPFGRYGKFVSHSPDYLATVKVNYKYEPEASAVRWKRFIHDIFKADQELINLAQEMAGYVLFAQNTLQKFFYLIGDGANGKSTFMAILNEVYGKENCTSLRPDRLSSSFDPMALQHSLLNLCYEGRQYLNGAEETLKAVVSGDPIMASHKGVDAVTFEPRAKWFIAANDLFNSRDATWGFLRRVLFLPFEASFEGEGADKKADPNMLPKLKEEIPGIFNWCLEGYRRLVEKQGFTQTQKQIEYMTKLKEHIEPIIIFARETLGGDVLKERTLGDINLSSFPDMRTVYGAYRTWCVESGYKIQPRPVFTERLKKILPSLQRDEGLRPAEIRKLGRKEYLIVQEMNDSILDAHDIGADNTIFSDLVHLLEEEFKKADLHRRIKELQKENVEMLRRKAAEEETRKKAEYARKLEEQRRQAENDAVNQARAQDKTLDLFSDDDAGADDAGSPEQTQARPSTGGGEANAPQVSEDKSETQAGSPSLKDTHNDYLAPYNSGYVAECRKENDSHDISQRAGTQGGADEHTVPEKQEE